MDSLTQIVLGAATAEAVVGKKIGNKALLLGAVVGTIPDLDVLANPFLSTVQELTFHRSFSHSFLFVVFGGWLFAYLTWKIFKWNTISFKELFWVFSLGFLTHILLDTCTTWGTQLLWPFSSYGFALYNVFVVDPHYTFPFLAILIMLMYCKPLNPWRSRLNWIGIGLSTCYLLAGLIMQHRAQIIFKNNLLAQGIVAEGVITKTTPFNIILWSCSVKTATGYYTGFYSFFDTDTKVKFLYEPSNQDLLEPYMNYPEVKTLISVSKNFYIVTPSEEGILLNDLRFGKFNGWQGEEEGDYVFKYLIKPRAHGAISIEQINYRKPINMSYLKAFYNRIMGNKE